MDEFNEKTLLLIEEMYESYVFSQPWFKGFISNESDVNFK